MEPGIVRYYEERNGNPAGIPVVQIGINLQANQDAQTDNFIRQAGYKTVANDVNRALASRFQSSGQPIFVIINGVANSPSHKQWELLVNQNGYGTTQHPIGSFRTAIDQVKAPISPPPMEAPSAPGITLQPQNQAAAVGVSVTLLVAANGTPPLSYQWWKDNQPIGNATSAALTLPSVRLDDAGGYSVVVSNVAGSVTSPKATLTILAPPTITAQPEDRIAIVGTNVSFTIEARGTSPFAYQWQFNGVDIPNATNAVLALNDVQPANGGVYRVVIRNSLGSATSAGATLIALVPAAIMIHPQNQTATMGQEVVLSVSVTGSEPITYQWSFNGIDLPGANSPRLILTNVQTAQMGRYGVTVRNGAGSVTSQTAVLAVALPPPARPALNGFRRLDDGSVEFNLNGEIGRQYRIDVSSDLLTWAPLTEVTAATASHKIRDASSASLSHRYYRAAAP